MTGEIEKSEEAEKLKETEETNETMRSAEDTMMPVSIPEFGIIFTLLSC